MTDVFRRNPDFGNQFVVHRNQARNGPAGLDDLADRFGNKFLYDALDRRTDQQPADPVLQLADGLPDFGQLCRDLRALLHQRLLVLRIELRLHGLNAVQRFNNEIITPIIVA